MAMSVDGTRFAFAEIICDSGLNPAAGITYKSKQKAGKRRLIAERYIRLLIVE
jgi:hypothetical protein